MNDAIREPCATALAALDLALNESAGSAQRDLEQALCCLVHMRDTLVSHTRRVPRQNGGILKEVNAVLSLVVGTEYPVSGIRKDNIMQARDALAKLLSQ